MTANTSAWRAYIPSQDTERSKELATCDIYEWTARRSAEPFVKGWLKHWEQLFSAPYNGISTDSSVRPEVHQLAKETEDHGAPVEHMVAAARKAISVATWDEERRLRLAVDAPEWRRWSNPEMYHFRHGVRLEEVSNDLVLALHDLLKASLSESGYRKATGCMKVNHFLGEEVNGRKVLNEKSYNFAIYGEPSETAPWGWQVFGHHLAMSCLVIKTQMVISPIFMGAEPNIIDRGPYKGTALFLGQESLALQLMQSLDSRTQVKVRIYKALNGPEYPEWRYHKADQRHLGGAFQDNKVIPYEGIKVTDFAGAAQDRVRELLARSLDHLPDKVLTSKLAEIASYWDETYFCWIGTWEEGSTFYYKIHSPVIMVEFDHHSGVFLNNKEPLPFHIHTLVRTPNANDYGKELLRQYRQREGA